MHRIMVLVLVIGSLLACGGLAEAQSNKKTQQQSQKSQKTQKSQKSKQTSKASKSSKGSQSKAKSGDSKAAAQNKGSKGTNAAEKPKPPANTGKKPEVEPPVNYGALPLSRLFNGSDLKGWKLRDPNGKNCWTVTDGVLANTDRGTDLITEEKFTDFELHLEVRVPKGGNSGVYLQGRYEIQVGDSAGMTDLTNSMMGAIYSKIAPKMNAAKPAGEWQTLDVHFMQAVKDSTGAIISKATATVILNDELIIDLAEIDGPTGGALDNEEGTPGPLMLQGDHTAVEYRNIIIRKLPPREPPKPDDDEEPPIPPKPADNNKDKDS